MKPQIIIVPLSELEIGEEFILTPTYPLYTWRDWLNYHVTHEPVYTLSAKNEHGAEAASRCIWRDNEPMTHHVSLTMPVIRAFKLSTIS